MIDIFNKNWFFISMITGVIFLAFSAMIQSWMLAFTTIGFIIVEFFIDRITSYRETSKTQSAIEKFQEGKLTESEEAPVRVKIPAAFMVFGIFFVVAFIELIIVIVLSY